MWELHGLWETTILHALKLRDATVRYVLCDGLYAECDVFWKATNPRYSLSCTKCQATVANLMVRMGMSFEWLGRYLLPEESSEAHRWANFLPNEALFGAEYKNWKVGSWIRSSVHSHLRMSELRLEDPQVEEAYRRYLYSGLIACFAISRLLDDYMPDVLFLFNGRMSSTRVAFELARERGIRVIVHERGFSKESLSLRENQTCESLNCLKELWKSWGEIPLSPNELTQIIKLLEERRVGDNLSWRPFSPPPQPPNVVLKRLDLCDDRPLWVLFTSSDDETIAAKEWKGVFSTQLEWIHRTLEYIKCHPDINFVIRVHPNTSGKKATGNNLQQLKEMEILRQNLPQNARMVMPEDEVSSYSLVDLATVGLVYHSTIGLEMACRGKTVVVAGGCLVSDMPFVLTVKCVDTYKCILDRLQKLPPKITFPDIQRMAYRYAYALFFRFNIPFPLVKMPDPHTGQLAYNSLECLLPGKDSSVDRVARIILEGEPICPHPLPEHRSRSEEVERTWLKAMGSKHSMEAKKTKPRVSVVIPCYNYGRYLADAVTSVVNQTYQDFEIIIVNDGSTDDSRKVAEQLIATHPEHQIRLINQTNSGQPAIARNRGISEARGEFILCLDADDMIKPTMLEECIHVMCINPDVDITYTDQESFGDGWSRVVQASNWDIRILPRSNQLPYCALYRREMWEKVGGYKTNVRGYEDWDFWISCAERGYKGKRIPKPLFRYREHGRGVYADALKQDVYLKAQIVLNHPKLYDEATVANAQKVISHHQRFALKVEKKKDLKNMPDPLVSVILPTYNRPTMLVNALISLFNQTYRDFEIIVVNDGGDDIENMITSLGSYRNITYVKHNTNRGTAAAKNSGIRIARGKYIAYLDDDDMYYPEHLETLVRVLEDSGNKVAYTDAYRAHQEKRNGEYVTVKKDVPYSFDFDHDRILISNFIPILCVMHEKSCIEEVGGFDESLQTHEDWDLWIRMSRKYIFMHINKITCEFRWRTDGSSTTSSKREDFVRSMCIIHDKYIKYTKNKPHICKAQQLVKKSLLADIVKPSVSVQRLAPNP